mmetsp:Transcript_52345/g.136889  ORF Transcript_52345/g.136889 Transcript_52345/m.136889 type:complete len:221 (+) Transcript_52345:2318-2980(+)
MTSRFSSAAAQKGAGAGQSNVIVFSTSLERLRSVAQTDDQRDTAIDVMSMNLESAVPAPTPSLLTGITVDEEIFVQQLYRRARILSRPFQKRVFQEIRRHAAPESFYTAEWDAQSPTSRTNTVPSTLASDSTLIKSVPSIDSSTIETVTQAEAQATYVPPRRRKSRAARVVDCVFKGTRGCESAKQAQVLQPPGAHRAYVSPVEVRIYLFGIRSVHRNQV